MRNWSLFRHEHECHGEGHPPGEFCEGINDAYMVIEEGPWWAFVGVWLYNHLLSPIANIEVGGSSATISDEDLIKIPTSEWEKYGFREGKRPFGFLWRVYGFFNERIEEVCEGTMPMKDLARVYPKTYERLMKEGYYK